MIEATPTARISFLFPPPPTKAFQPSGNTVISRIKLEVQTKSATNHIPSVPSQGAFEEKMINSFITSTKETFLLAFSSPLQ
jgi:hypothetical protein